MAGPLPPWPSWSSPSDENSPLDLVPWTCHLGTRHTEEKQGHSAALLTSLGQHHPTPSTPCGSPTWSAPESCLESLTSLK